MEFPTPRTRRPLELISPHSPKHGAPLTAPLGSTLSRSPAWRLHSPKGSDQREPYLDADYNIGCKRKQTGVVPQFEFSGY